MLIAAVLIVTARLVHVGNLDAQALADEVATPDPVSALDGPELRLRAAIPQPDGWPQVLLHVCWPAHPRQAATLLVTLDGADYRSLALPSHWCVLQASISPVRPRGAQLKLRRRQAWSAYTPYWSRRTPRTTVRLDTTQGARGITWQPAGRANPGHPAGRLGV